ncbi:unnamed protein product, partial [Sphagnum tenellum]
TITGNPGLTGNLPSEIGSLTNLTVLDLSNNQIYGKLPPSLWYLSTNFTVLNLSGNNFSGNFPPVTSPQN